MRSDLVDALTDPGERPSPDEVARALRLVRRRHMRRRVGVVGLLTAAVVGLVGAAAVVTARGGQQIVADRSLLDTPDSTQTGDEGDDLGLAAEVPLSDRSGPAVVWTGSELIVSGGFSPAVTNEFADAEFFFDGAAYDPVSGGWRSIADMPTVAMTYPASVWTGERLLVVGAAGLFGYDPVSDEWGVLADPPFALPELGRDNELFEWAWSGDVLFVWRPSTDQMAFYDPADNRWETMPGPDMDVSPAKLLADGNRVVALGTGRPHREVPVSLDVQAAEWIDGQWRYYDPVSFVTENNANVADLDAAALVNGTVVVWGDFSNDPGPTYLLDHDGGWSPAPPMPIYAGMGHPGSVILGERILALSEGPDAAIFDVGTQTWTATRLPALGPSGMEWTGMAAHQTVWTGSELLAWNGSTVIRWTPFDPTGSTNETADQGTLGDQFIYPAGCGPSAFGRADTRSDDLLATETLPSWTRSEAGQWLGALISEAGYSQPFDAGSAFVFAHGVDGTALIWLGPANDTADLDLAPTVTKPVDVEAGIVEPSSPFDDQPYRQASVFTTVSGDVRLWMLVNPRDRWEETNFPGLTNGAPCLPDDQDLIDALLTIAIAADRTPYQGQLPESAGRFAINSDVGISATDPGDRHLIERAARVLDAPLRQPGSAAVISRSSLSRWIYTGTPPYETDPNASAGSQPRVTAGGLEILFWLQDGPPTLTDEELADLQLIAAALDNDPFLGQPTP